VDVWKAFLGAATEDDVAVIESKLVKGLEAAASDRLKEVSK
jgi:hypothetical protein